MYINYEGKLYKVIEEDIKVEAEEQKLSAWESAVENDARELQEYQAKIDEIESFDIPEQYKVKLKETVSVASPSGIKPEMVEEQRQRLNKLKEL